jgi:hypothetical protein
MVWSGYFYVIILTVGFFAHALVANDISRAITPGYWTPYTILDIGKITGGYSIEDIFFMFFLGGIATSIYEVVFRKKILERTNKKLKKRHALLIAAIGTVIFAKLVYINDVYLLMAFNFIGVMVIIFQRPDLIKHSIFGGILTLGVYISAFLALLLIYPNLTAEIYQLKLTTGRIILDIPLEEYIYAFSFGMLWAPLYEYEHAYKDA